jgi:hypothetical protein
LWQATLAYAQGTQAGDPGPRSEYRNYWLGSWHYWAPTGTPTTNPLLSSVSFNRFLGFIQTVPGVRGGVTFPPATTPNYTGTNDFLADAPGGMTAISLADGHIVWQAPPQPLICGEKKPGCDQQCCWRHRTTGSSHFVT